MARRKTGGKARGFALKGKASYSRSRIKGATSNGPVTSKRIAQSLRYLNEDAFRSPTKK